MLRPAILLIVLALVCPTTRGEESKKSSPWKDKPHPIPGRIEAEHYDEGPAGIAYYDVDEENLGAPYRTDTQVDIEERSDASNGYGIGWTREGEWLMYTVDVKGDGDYTMLIPVASNKKGGTFHLEVDDEDISGPIHVPDTGGWSKLKTITHKGVKLKKGVQTIKVVMDKQGPSGSIGDIDYFEFKAVR